MKTTCSIWHKLSKEQLAERLGLAVSMLYRIANEREVWSVGQVRRLLTKIVVENESMEGNQ